MGSQIVFRQYNPNKPHRYGLLLKSLNIARFHYIYKAVPSAAKQKTGDGPYYLKSTIDCIKYLVIAMEAVQHITIDYGKKKTQIIKLYDFTKGGPDLVDQLNDY